MKSKFGSVCHSLILIIMALYGCKESTIVDSNLLSSADDINTITFPDTLPIITRTVYDDSIITSYNVAPVYGGLGTVNDPYFGRTSAGIALQLVPPTTAFQFGKKPDSAVLILPYSGFGWGDTGNGNQLQKFTVYQLQEKMSLDADYYSFQRFPVDRTTPLGTAEVSLAEIKTSSVPHLRIKLSQAFLDKLYSQDKSVYSSYPDFLNYFKGLYIEPDTTSSIANALYYFRLDGTSNLNTAGIVFYATDSVMTAFSFSTGSCAQYTWLSRSLSPAVTNYLNSKATADTILLQNEPGTAFEIIIPGIQSIPKSMINMARLEISLLPDPMNAIFTPPSRIYPIGVDAGGGSYNIADRLPLNSASPLDFIDGRSRPVIANGDSRLVYTINFPRELQQAILQGKDELRLRITGTQTFPGAYRLIAGGRGFSNPDYRLKLNIVYSKLN